MLQFIRDRVTGVVAFFILGLLAVPFMFFGIDSYIRDVPQDVVAQVGESEITINDFQAEFARYRTQLRQQQGDAYDDLAANSPQARREFLEGMIEQRLLANHAEELGLIVSPEALFEVVRNIPAFQINGQFDPEIYRQRIQASGQTLSSFERDLARDLLTRALPGAVSASVAPTEADVDRLLAVQMQEREVAVVRVASTPFIEPDSIDSERIQSYYDDNTDQFMRPEQVTVEYIELDTGEMVADAEIEEEVLRERYEAVQGRFMTPERRRAAHILITENDERDAEQARQLAEELKARIESGESFAELAAEYSDDPGSAEQGGDLGWIEPDVMMPEFEDALYSMETGEVSDPVETEFGWHLIRLDEIEPPRGQTFAEARDEIAAEIREERADDLFVEQSERLVDLVYADPTGLDAVAEDLGLELETAGPYSRFSAEGVLAEPEVLQATFSDLVLIDRQASEPIEIDRNHAVVVRVTDYQPAEPRPLEAVSDEIRNRLAREAARDAAREYAASLVERARQEGQGLSEVAEAEELEYTERRVSRRDFDVGADLLQGIFRLPVPGDEPSYEIVDAGGGWAVVRLDEVVPGNPAEADEARRSSARQQIVFSRAGREVRGLLEWLRANTEITVAEERI